MEPGASPPRKVRRPGSDEDDEQADSEDDALNLFGDHDGADGDEQM